MKIVYNRRFCAIFHFFKRKIAQNLQLGISHQD